MRDREHNKLKGKKRQKENIRQVFASLKFVYYLCVFSGDSKTVSFPPFLVRSCSKRRGENDKAEVQQIGGEKGKTRLDAISTKNQRVAFGACVNVLVSHAESQ
jgi:hypothetical protein